MLIVYAAVKASNGENYKYFAKTHRNGLKSSFTIGHSALNVDPKELFIYKVLEKCIKSLNMKGVEAYKR